MTSGRLGLFANHDGDLRKRLLDARGPTAGAGGEALHDPDLSDGRLRDKQTVDIQAVVVLGVRDRRIERLANILADPARTEIQLVESLLHLQAADRLGD